jgi:opacity protein-like surface antigen
VAPGKVTGVIDGKGSGVILWSVKTKQEKESMFADLTTAAYRVWGAGCAVLWLGLAAASAQVYAAPPYAAPAYVVDSIQDAGFYLSADLGPSFMPDFQSSRFGFPGSFSARSGVRFSAEPGYNFLANERLTLGGEFETGVIYNDLSSVRGAGSPMLLRGDYYQMPLLVNLVLKLHPGPFVVPYVGIGGGGDYSSARIRSARFFGFETTSDEVDPAAQGMAGVRFRLNASSELGLGYKFLAAFPGEGRYIATHSVAASFTIKF